MIVQSYCQNDIYYTHYVLFHLYKISLTFCLLHFYWDLCQCY